MTLGVTSGRENSSFRLGMRDTLLISIYPQHVQLRMPQALQPPEGQEPEGQLNRRKKHRH